MEASSSSTSNPYLQIVTKKLRALRKKNEKIKKTEEQRDSGKVRLVGSTAERARLVKIA
jgi:hypothetical protein